MESRLAVRGRIRASGKYLCGFGSASGHGCGERFGGNLLAVRVALHYLRGLLKVEALFDEAQIRNGEPIGELLPHAGDVTQSVRNDLSRCLQDLIRFLSEMACSMAGFHANQVRAAVFKAFVQALEM